MTRGPDPEIIRAAVGLAIRAPSVHNTQPWRFRFGRGGLHLYADPARHLTATDPDGRDLIVSCGAALHHLRVALAALGWLPVTYRLPDPHDPHHLAVVTTVPRAPSHADLSFSATIPHRHSDRRPYLPTTLEPDTITELTRQAAAHGTALRVVPDGPTRSVLVSAIAEATMQQRANPSYVYELARWTGTRTDATDGVPSAHTPTATTLGDLTLRQFSVPGLHSLDPESTEDGAGILLALGTTDDDQLSRLRAGEAGSAVMLTATRLGLTTCPLTQPLEITAIRDLIRTRVLDGIVVHLLLRIGKPAEPSPYPRTPRRPVADVLTFHDSRQ